MLLTGNLHTDQRGVITYNNDFDASIIKRIYTIENHSLEFIRGWQGHKIEQRWFAAMTGSFKISMMAIDDFDAPSKDLESKTYILDTQGLNFLHIPAGYITAIRALEEKSKLLVLADYSLGEVKDEYRYPINYFTTKL